MVSLSRKALRGLCCTPYCRKTARAGKHYCHRCTKRKWREKNPIHDAFLNLKHHAKQRRIGFELTLEEFTKFCHETNYHENKGRKNESTTVDRIDPNGPYSISNIRPLSHLENSTRRDAPPEPPKKTKTRHGDSPFDDEEYEDDDPF